MGKLPAEIKLTRHAKQRLEERKEPENYYNPKNIMRSSCKWYTKDDLIPKSNLYLHCLYVCRKSNQMGYITDGKIEVLYNKGTGVAITIMEVKEKFQPITQYIKPEILEQIERKKNKQKVNDTLNLEYKVRETTIKNKQTYNIVYRERTTNIKTISELFGANKKSYEETLLAVK